jgi:hypothetical protein
MTPVPKASGPGPDENDKTDRFDTTTGKDTTLNAAVWGGVVPSSRSSPAIQKMKNICAPARFEITQMVSTDSRVHASGNRGGIAIPHHMPQLLEPEAACDAFRGINEREVSRVEN